jgi:hypothetical protein
VAGSNQGRFTVRQTSYLNEELKRDAEMSNTGSPFITYEIYQEDKNHFILSCWGLSLVIKWNCRYSNTLDDSALTVEGYKKKSNRAGHPIFMEEDRDYQAIYTIAINKD